MLNSDLLIPVGYETSKYGYTPRQTSRSNGWTPNCPNKRSIKEIYETIRVHSNDREGVPMAKSGRLSILKKEIAPLLQVVTSYSSPGLMELTLFLKGTRNIVREVRLDPLKEVICLGFEKRGNSEDAENGRVYGGTEGSSGVGKADPSASTSQDASSRSEHLLEVSQEELWRNVDRVGSERNVVMDSDWTSKWVTSRENLLGDLINELRGREHIRPLAPYRLQAVVDYLGSEYSVEYLDEIIRDNSGMEVTRKIYSFSNLPTKTDVQKEIGGISPPKGIVVLDPREIPFLNTLIPLSFGAAVTWAHHAILAVKEKRAVYALVATVSLALVFTSFQGMKYYQAPSIISDSIYGSTFFLATGFHGFHVIIAAWYWHFVDVVRLFPFVSIYCGESAGGLVNVGPQSKRRADQLKE
nr:cytochrome c oxidase subunit 3, mitochondrial [Tanacetum cinerariifolium]